MTPRITEHPVSPSPALRMEERGWEGPYQDVTIPFHTATTGGREEQLLFPEWGGSQSQASSPRGLPLPLEDPELRYPAFLSHGASKPVWPPHLSCDPGAQVPQPLSPKVSNPVPCLTSLKVPDSQFELLQAAPGTPFILLNLGDWAVPIPSPTRSSPGPKAGV
jgi:hypothetical protein